MNDDDLMTAVRDRFAAVRMDTPAEMIMARGSSLRRRRGGRLAAGALAVSLGAGLSVPALTAGTAAPAQRATLAAWTVHKHHDGSIGVTIRRWQRIGALEVKLGALGAPVIIVAGQARPGHGCAVLWIRPAAFQIRVARAPHAVAFEVMPGKIPPHAVLWIAVPRADALVPGAVRPASVRPAAVGHERPRPGAVQRVRPGQREPGALAFAVASAMSCKPLTPVTHAH